MTDKEIDRKLGHVIIMLHECGYDHDYILCPNDQRISVIGGDERYSASEAEISLVGAYYHDNSGLSTAIFTVRTPNGKKGILLTRHGSDNAGGHEKKLTGPLVAQSRAPLL